MSQINTKSPPSAAPQTRKKKFRVPISVKLIVIFAGFLSVATIIFAQQSSELFSKVLVQREEFSNMSEATSKSVEIEQTVLNLIDRAQILGPQLYKEVAGRDPKTMTLSNDFLLNFDKEKNVVSIEIWTQQNQQLSLVFRHTKEKFIEENNLNQTSVTPSGSTQTPVTAQTFFDDMRTRQRFPFSAVLQKSLEIRNGSRPEGPAVATLGIPLVKNGKDEVTHILLVDFSLAMLQKSFSVASERVQFMVDRDGIYLAHGDDKKVLSMELAKASPLVDRAMGDSQPRRQIQFTDPADGDVYIGAYVKLTALGLTVFSQTSKTLILEPAKNVQRRAWYIAGSVISIAILLIFMFSMTLTGPIEVLASLVGTVSRGNFDIRAGDRIRSSIEDEVHDLAHAFDHMTEGLKERDKVKNLFNKFHGSSITEDLLNKDIGVGGANKMVTVFFSDIRGFTAFSENKTPEEVVEMLNEYFQVMVSIVNKYGGVVDKFIGDAIMAVWGAPKESDRDTQQALLACLEMRQALAALNETRKSRNQKPLFIGMGLHCGRAISGTIGSQERMEYTVIGDTVNMSSRIESSTKTFGVDLLVSEAVFDKVGDEFDFEKSGEATVKGKAEPIKLYKVTGYRDLNSGRYVEVKTEYSHFAKETDAKVKVA